MPLQSRPQARLTIVKSSGDNLCGGRNLIIGIGLKVSKFWNLLTFNTSTENLMGTNPHCPHIFCRASQWPSITTRPAATQQTPRRLWCNSGAVLPLTGAALGALTGAAGDSGHWPRELREVRGGWYGLHFWIWKIVWHIHKTTNQKKLNLNFVFTGKTLPVLWLPDNVKQIWWYSNRE